MNKNFSKLFLMALLVVFLTSCESNSANTPPQSQDADAVGETAETMTVSEYLSTDKIGAIEKSELEQCTPALIAELYITSIKKGDNLLLSSLWNNKTFDAFEPINIIDFSVENAQDVSDTEVWVKVIYDIEFEDLKEPLPTAGGNEPILIIKKINSQWKIEGYGPTGI